jgi:TolB-like protein/Tfp pilus assembly protein PilF
MGLAPGQKTRLDSWKAIAQYLGREVRTVIRWEKERHLPVHRLPGGKHHGVFAYSEEIDGWLRGEPSDLPEAKGPSSRRLLKLLLAGLAAALVMGGVSVALNIGVWRSRLRASISPRTIASIAVLPLQDLSGDPSQEYFAYGLTDALVTDLAQIRALRVISPTSVMRYKGTQKPLPEIGRELSVDAVVEGSVVRSGSRVRIAAQLVETRTDAHLWAQSYEGDVRDLLALQSQVAQAIAKQVRVTLTPDERLRLRTVRAVTPEAHEAYLKARYYWNKRTPQDLLRSIELSQEAIRKAPDYAEAYAALGSAYVTLLASDQFMPREMAAKAKAAAEKALAIEEALAEPHAVLAIQNAVHDYDWEASDTEFRRAMELDPNYAVAHHWYALTLSSRGRYDQAYLEIQKAHELDPLSSIEGSTVAYVLYWSRKYEPCIEQAGRVLELDPSFFWGRLVRGQCAEQTGKYGAAISDYEEALRISNRSTGAIARLGHVFATVGRRSEALAMLSELTQATRSRYSSAWQPALIYTALGDREQALASLERDYEQRGSGMLLLKAEPIFDPLRSHPRFAALLRKTNLGE